MARIEIKDLAADETLDADALKRVRGGLLVSSYDPAVSSSLNFTIKLTTDLKLDSYYTQKW